MSTPNDPPQSRRAARQAEVTAQDAHAVPPPPPLTRRPRAGAPASMPPEMPGDVSYRTEIRPRVPHYDAPPTDHAVIGVDGQPILRPDGQGAGAAPFVAPPLVEPAVAPPVAPAASRTGEQMRRRDFRPAAEQPEQASTALTDAAVPDAAGSGAAVPGAAVPGGAMPGAAWADPRATPIFMPSVDAPLDYHTQLAPGAFEPNVSIPPVAPPMPSQPLETTLSRREIRELRDRADPSGGVASGPSPVADSFGATAAPPLVSPAAFAPPMNQPPVYAQPEYAQPAYAQPDSAQAAYAQPEYAPPAAPPPSATAPPASAPVPTSTGSHWSVGIHDDDDPFENTFSREVGSAVSLSNTNALVLPEMPTGSISGPVAGTGEIIITGMIDVPSVVSSTGAVPAVHESPEIDDLFDPGDLVAGPADAAPVSALKAVSSHTSSHSVIATGKRSSSNAITTVLVASTVVMAVVAIGLFVIAAANGLF
ncbi:MAG: hypothetical protein C0444_02420 [Microbacterium sp.]|nr:hypothetical protein [Microbacterium sp.]MBA4345407.1 hypothetical protein [Microbacterium sp.]